eukprot:gene27937-biopygen3362
MSSLDVLLAAAHVKNFPAPTEATHGAMGDPMFGSFAIPDGGPQSQAFREAYVHALRDEGRHLSIVETHTDTSPIIVDLDMRQNTPERMYTQKHIENFMDALVSATKYFVDQQHMDVVILEKPNPRLDKKHLGVYKDGLHVVMPNVITHPEIQLAIREHFVNDMTEHMAFSSTICIPGMAEMDPGKIYDKSVITPGGRWFLYGSKKPDETHPWKVTAWYQLDTGAGSLKKLDVQNMDLDTLVQNLSIRVHPHGGHSIYTKYGQEEIDQYKIQNVSQTKKTFDSQHGRNVESLYNLVDILDAQRASGYDSWLKVGMALKNTVDAGTDTQRLDIWKSFAKKCPDKFCDTKHEQVWANLKPTNITLGTLRFLAKQDDPMGYAEWILKWDNANKQGEEIDKDRIIKDLKVKLELAIDNMVSLNVVNDSIEFKIDNGAKGAIHKNKYMVEVDEIYYGSMIDKFPIHEDPGFIKNVPIDQGPFECELRTMDGKTINSAILKSTDGLQIALMNMGSDNQYVNVRSNTSNATIRDKQVINTIHNMIFKAQESHAKNMYGITQNIFLVNNTININMKRGDDDDDDSFSSSIKEDTLAEKFMEAAPEFFTRIKCVPKLNRKECVGDMYYCDPATNRWSNLSNLMIIKVIKLELKSKFPAEKNNKTNKKIRGFVDTVKGRSVLLQAIALLVLDETFTDNLDVNPDLFAVNNGVFDSLSRDNVVFRNVEITDNISRCAKWDYQGEEDNHNLQRCKEELDDFFLKILPVEEERDVVLSFFAGLLTGRRDEKKFLAFTDKTSGDNGKSTLMTLMGSFFSSYKSSNGKKFLTKGSFARSRDDHDAGLEAMKGLRLLVADEMKSNIPLDEAARERVERRNLTKILPTWLSALAQLFIEHLSRPGRSSIFDKLPVSMTEWKSGIADSANPLAEWLEEVVEVTGECSDVVWAGDLKARWIESHYGPAAAVFSNRLVKAFFSGKQGIEWKDSARIDTICKKGHTSLFDAFTVLMLRDETVEQRLDIVDTDGLIGGDRPQVPVEGLCPITVGHISSTISDFHSVI